MMLLKLLELWTVSAGILIALWYILLSNTTGGVYITGKTNLKMNGYISRVLECVFFEFISQNEAACDILFAFLDEETLS